MIHGPGHAGTTFRRDWNLDACTPVGASDPIHRDTCPNTL